MFKLTQVPATRLVVAAFEILGDRGETIPQAMTLEVRVDDLDEIDATRKRVLADAKKRAAKGEKVSPETLFVKEYTVGWTDIEGDDDKPFPFTPENFDRVLRIPEARIAIIDAVAGHVNREDLLKGN